MISGRTASLTRSLLVRLDKDGLDAWATRLRPTDASGCPSVEPLLELKASSAELSTKTKAVLNQLVDLLQTDGAHREVLLEAAVWCMDTHTFDAFRLRIERFFENDRVVAGSIETSTADIARHWAILRGDDTFVPDLAEARSVAANLWFTDGYPPTLEQEAFEKETARRPDLRVHVSAGEPDHPSYEERLAERARDQLVQDQAFQALAAQDDLLYWDANMLALWHRPRSPLRPPPQETALTSFRLPPRCVELDMVLGARSQGSYEKREQLTLLRQLNWAAWYEEPATGDWWYEDVPPEAARAGGPPRFRRAGVRRKRRSSP